MTHGTQAHTQIPHSTTSHTTTTTSTDLSKSVKSAFDAMRFIVTVGWSIYPLGYFFGYLFGAVAPSALNLIYNLADFVNKIAFCLVIWHAAKTETLAKSNDLKEPKVKP